MHQIRLVNIQPHKKKILQNKIFMDLIMSDLEKRVDKHEWILKTHDDELRSLKDNEEKMQTTLFSIQQNLNQIKWIALGFIAATAASELGLVQALKLL